MADRVYIETTVVSYLTARPSRDLIIAAHQQIAKVGGIPVERTTSFAFRNSFSTKPGLEVRRLPRNVCSSYSPCS